MTQDKAPEWLAELAAETTQIVFDASVDLYEQGAAGSDPQHVIALALSQAYERGQVDMREACAVVAGETVSISFIKADRLLASQHGFKIAKSIRSLPINDSAGKDAS